MASKSPAANLATKSESTPAALLGIMRGTLLSK